MPKGIRLLTLLLIATGCSAPNSIRYSSRPILKHTYSVCITAENQEAKRFTKILKEELLWEQYLYIAPCSDADTIMKIKVISQNQKSLDITISYTEKATGDKETQRIKIRITKGNLLETGAKLLAHHLHEMLILPPEVEAATPYGDMGDPGGEAAK